MRPNVAVDAPSRLTCFRNRHAVPFRGTHSLRSIRSRRRNPRPDNTFAGRVFRNAIQQLNQAAAQKGPFALVVDTYEPHEPWTPPARFLDRYGGWEGREPAMPQYGRAATWLGGAERGPVINRMRDLYAAEVTMTDHWLGMLIDRLHELNL